MNDHGHDVPTGPEKPKPAVSGPVSEVSLDEMHAHGAEAPVSEPQGGPPHPLSQHAAAWRYRRRPEQSARELHG